MIKKSLALVLSLVLPALALAAVTDFTANSNITVSAVTFGAGTANMIIFSGSNSASWTYNAGAFTATDPGSAFNVGSADATVKTIAVSSGATTLVCALNTIPGTSFATLPTSAGTYTVTPSAYVSCDSFCPTLSNTATYNAFPTCGALTCSSGYTVSGSGSSATCTATVAVTTTTTTTSSAGGAVSMAFLGCGVGYVYNGMTCAPIINVKPVIATASAPVLLTSAVFSKKLLLGMKSDDVRRLQILLASDKEIYSDGNTEGYFGSLTKKAVGRFQLKYKLLSSATAEGYGELGPKTRAKIQEVFGKGVSTPATLSTLTTTTIPVSSGVKSATTTLSTKPSAIFTKYLSIGMTSDDVRRLQMILATDKEIYPEGIIEGHFGELTRTAVGRFQIKYGVATSSKSEGYGELGPKTRAKLNEVFGK